MPSCFSTVLKSPGVCYGFFPLKSVRVCLEESHLTGGSLFDVAHRGNKPLLVYFITSDKKVIKDYAQGCC